MNAFCLRSAARIAVCIALIVCGYFASATWAAVRSGNSYPLAPPGAEYYENIASVIPREGDGEYERGLSIWAGSAQMTLSSWRYTTGSYRSQGIWSVPADVSGLFHLESSGSTDDLSLSFPTWWIFVPLIGSTLLLARPYLIRRRRERRGACLACGYDLRGSVGGVCSECGTRMIAATSR